MAKWDHLDVDESGARNKDVSVLHQPCGVNVDESATASNVVSVFDESCSLGENESGARSKIVSVFDQPWDIQTSKFNMFVSSIRHSVVKGTRDLRNSLFGGQSRVNKCVENKNGAYSDVELNQHQFSSKLQRHDSSSCNNNLSTIEQKAEGQLEKPVASFPVLPYSDRIEVKMIPLINICVTADMPGFVVTSIQDLASFIAPHFLMIWYDRTSVL